MRHSDISGASLGRVYGTGDMRSHEAGWQEWAPSGPFGVDPYAQAPTQTVSHAPTHLYASDVGLAASGAREQLQYVGASVHAATVPPWRLADADFVQPHQQYQVFQAPTLAGHTVHEDARVHLWPQDQPAEHGVVVHHQPFANGMATQHPDYEIAGNTAHANWSDAHVHQRSAHHGPHAGHNVWQYHITPHHAVHAAHPAVHEQGWPASYEAASPSVQPQMSVHPAQDAPVGNNRHGAADGLQFDAEAAWASDLSSRGPGYVASPRSAQHAYQRAHEYQQADWHSAQPAQQFDIMSAFDSALAAQPEQCAAAPAQLQQHAAPVHEDVHWQAWQQQEWSVCAHRDERADGINAVQQLRQHGEQGAWGPRRFADGATHQQQSDVLHLHDNLPVGLQTQLAGPATASPRVHSAHDAHGLRRADWQSPPAMASPPRARHSGQRGASSESGELMSGSSRSHGGGTHSSQSRSVQTQPEASSSTAPSPSAGAAAPAVDAPQHSGKTQPLVSASPPHAAARTASQSSSPQRSASCSGGSPPARRGRRASPPPAPWTSSSSGGNVLSSEPSTLEREESAASLLLSGTSESSSRSASVSSQPSSSRPDRGSEQRAQSPEHVAAHIPGAMLGPDAGPIEGPIRRRSADGQHAIGATGVFSSV